MPPTPSTTTTPRSLHPLDPPSPIPPFPLRLSGPIIQGFGRGSSDLGIPTANIPIAGLSVGGNERLESGVYYGWAGVDVDGEGRRMGSGDGDGGGEGEGEGEGGEGGEAGDGVMEGGKEGGDGERNGEGKKEVRGNVWAMVMSIGWNPFYKNTKRSVEVHILHTFPRAFYSAHLNLLICGFIRPELDYVSKEKLIEDINIDIEVARRGLEREAYRRLKGEGWLVEF